MGAYLSALGPAIPTNSASTAMGGVYAIPAIFMDVKGVFTNTVPVDAYRGAGKPEANYIIERLVDLAARRLRVSPVELRRRNIISRFPYHSALGMSIEEGAFGTGLDLVVATADVEGFERRRSAARNRGKLRRATLARDSPPARRRGRALKRLASSTLQCCSLQSREASARG
jgi:carbon-monoxide dehydrogenase large subunit